MTNSQKTFYFVFKSVIINRCCGFTKNIMRGRLYEFKKDQICGKGRYKWNNKKEFFGEWENNEISGYGNLLDGPVRHIGYFLHNMKDGFGASFYEEQSYVLIGKWEEDLIEGPAILLPLDKNNNKKINETIFSKEKIVGMYKGEMINMNLGEEDISTFNNSLEDRMKEAYNIDPTRKKAMIGENLYIYNEEYSYEANNKTLDEFITKCSNRFY